MNTPSTNSTTTLSYAKVAQQTVFPTKEQAIVLDSVDGIPVQEYAYSIAKIITAKNIRFISRISHGRVCLYLNSKETADRLIESHSKINIQDHVLEIRPLMSKAKRIILSNVCPIIPHHVLTDLFKDLNIRICSQLTFIRAGMGDNSFSHIMSFRRQVYIHPDDVSKLPEVLQLSYDGTNYWIYLSTEKLTCFLCKEEGHLAKFCKNTESTTRQLTTPPTVSKEEIPTLISPTIMTKVINVCPSASEEKDLVDSPVNKILLPPPTVKRPLSSASSTSQVASCASGDAHSNVISSKIKTTSKKMKRSEVSDVDLAAQLQPAKEVITANAQKYPMSFENIVEFLQQSYDNPKTLVSASRYTNDISALVHMLSDIKDLLSERCLKNRISRIIKKLILNSNLDPDEGSSTDSSFKESQEA